MSKRTKLIALALVAQVGVGALVAGSVVAASTGTVDPFSGTTTTTSAPKTTAVTAVAVRPGVRSPATLLPVGP